MPFVLVFSAACLIFFAELGKYPLFNPDEALYAEPAREMLETGEYVTTLLNYVVRFTKPPLTIWAMAGCYKVFAVNEFAARFPGALAAALLVAFTYFFAERYLSRKAALIAAFSLITAPLFVATAREAITDMPLTLFVACALMSFYHSYVSKIGSWRWLAYVFVGLAVMTKGPVGLILPLLVVGVYHSIRREVVSALRWYKPHLGLIIVAAIAVPWFAIEIAITKGAYYNEFLLRENFQRFTGVVDHKYPFWYHVPAMFGGFLPWSIFLPQAFYAVARNWREHVDANKPSLLLFCSLWSLLILAFFSTSVSKLIPYTLPAFPALALLIAERLEYFRKESKTAQIVWPLAILTAVFAVALAVSPLLLPKLRHMPADLPALVQSFIQAELCVMAAVFVCLSAGRRGLAITCFAGMMLATFMVFGERVLTVLSLEWEEPIPIFANYAAVSDWPFIVYNMRKPSVPFYLHRPVLLPSGKEDLQANLSMLPHAYVMAPVSEEGFLTTEAHCQVIARRGRFLLLAYRHD